MDVMIALTVIYAIVFTVQLIALIHVVGKSIGDWLYRQKHRS